MPDFAPKLLLAMLVILLSSCTSLKDKGDKSFESGLFKEAADYYLQALKKNPDDIDARLGLERARYKVIDQTLIDVRMLRLANNQYEAALKLEEVYQNQKAWGVTAKGAVAYTLKEEFNYARPWLDEQLKNIYSLGNVDRYLWFAYSLKNLLTVGGLNKQVDGYKQKLTPTALRTCQTLKQNLKSQSFEFYRLAKSYCNYWGDSVNFKLDKIDKDRFKQVRFSNRVRYEGRQSREKSYLLDNHLSDFQNRFQQSIWYSSAGRTLVVDIDGRLNYRRTIHEHKQSKDYQIKRREESGQKGTADYKAETIVEDKVHYYTVQKKYEKIVSNFNFSTLLHGNQLVQNIGFEEEHHSVGHSERHKPSGLKPQKHTSMNLERIFQRRFAAKLDQFYYKLEREWQARYCKSNAYETFQIEESIIRCALIEPDNTGVDNWFENKFGIKYREFRRIYGL